MTYTFAGICQGTTKAGTRCRRIVVYANGFCKAHGGDSTEYMKFNIERILRKSRGRMKRLQRRMASQAQSGA